VLEADGLRVNYAAVSAVDGISLRVDEGECVCLLGPNGAGKSSTLRAISGEVAASGTLRFDGDDIRGGSAEARARMGIIQVPEGRKLFPSLTVHENLLVGGAARGRRRPTFAVDDVYSLFPTLVALRSRRAWALSGGEQQMVALGRGLVGAPRLLMLDEPSLGLSPKIIEVVFDALAQIRTRVAILIVEQNTALALESSDRGYVMASGRIVMDGLAAELADRSRLLSTYLGQQGTAAEAELNHELETHGLG
jgi:branched-chain amino acid transport system ATP-binding protein